MRFIASFLLLFPTIGATEPITQFPSPGLIATGWPEVTDEFEPGPVVAANVADRMVILPFSAPIPMSRPQFFEAFGENLTYLVAQEYGLAIDGPALVSSVLFSASNGIFRGSDSLPASLLAGESLANLRDGPEAQQFLAVTNRMLQALANELGSMLFEANLESLPASASRARYVLRITGVGIAIEAASQGGRAAAVVLHAFYETTSNRAPGFVPRQLIEDELMIAAYKTCDDDTPVQFRDNAVFSPRTGEVWVERGEVTCDHAEDSLTCTDQGCERAIYRIGRDNSYVMVGLVRRNPNQEARGQIPVPTRRPEFFVSYPLYPSLIGAIPRPIELSRRDVAAFEDDVFWSAFDASLLNLLENRLSEMPFRNAVFHARWAVTQFRDPSRRLDQSDPIGRTVGGISALRNNPMFSEEALAFHEAALGLSRQLVDALVGDDARLALFEVPEGDRYPSYLPTTEATLEISGDSAAIVVAAMTFEAVQDALLEWRGEEIDNAETNWLDGVSLSPPPPISNESISGQCRTTQHVIAGHVMTMQFCGPSFR